MTGGTAREMAEQSAAQARQELAAVVCVDRFMAAPDMHAQLTALKGIERSYQRGKFVEDGGWAIMPVGSSAATSTPVSSGDQRKAAGLCAEELAKQEIPAAGDRRAGHRADPRGAVGRAAPLAAGASEAARARRRLDRAHSEGRPPG